MVYQGDPAGILKAKDSLTGDYLAGRKKIEVPEQRRVVDKQRMLKVVGARENNLDNVDVSIPLGVLVAVTGVSGSGKSTLVNQILAKTLQNQLNGARQVPGLSLIHI